MRAAFNGWLTGLVADFIDAHLVLFAMGLLTTPDPTTGVRQAHTGALMVANASFVLVVTLAGVLVMANPTVQSSAGVKELAPRVVLAFLAANASWLVCSVLADMGNALTVGLLEGAAQPEAVAQAIERTLQDPLGELVLVVLLTVVAALLVLFFAVAVIVRVMLWLLLTAAAPLALVCHALPQTEGVARLWWRAMGALLVIQVAQALTLRVLTQVFLVRREADFLTDPAGTADSMLDVIVLITAMYVLVRIPFWAFRQVFNTRGSPLVRVVRFAVGALVLRNVGRALATAAGRTTPRPGAGRGGRPGPPPPRGGPGRGPAPRPPRPSGPGRGLAPRPRWGGGGGRPMWSSSPPPRPESPTAPGKETPPNDRSSTGRGQGRGPVRAERTSFAGTPRHYAGGVWVQRPRPRSAPPPPDPRRYRTVRPSDIRITPPRPPRPEPPESTHPPNAGQRRPVRPRPRHYRRRPRGEQE
ncbi:hypothetical protein LG943_12625 [Streptomonospora sp. S1-112]|uniref:TrbL/VirB6 plasmid conjugal transfer protein n=1 Tax=Streptomonospora mangrovi TaxID=2883123 RepID=A0A9X3SDR7_9ACTN|nr:hypothetical protein [Streptomonospora mangrovi]MDA0565153.1 hypothetical protein [Streptomonospora mangrovi]